jgi:hypothetical protein
MEGDQIMSIASRSYRWPTFSPAKLVCDDGRALACVVENVSSGGAKIDLGEDLPVPEAFHFAADNLRVHAPAKIVWRAGPQIGIQFTVRQAHIRAEPHRVRTASGARAVSLSNLTGRLGGMPPR